MLSARVLESCPAVIFIVYTPGPGAESRGYARWLREVDNPFFNAIPGVRHYANWKIEQIIGGAPPEYDYFDFQGLTRAEDLEPVWFNADLDRFRREWVRLWGYTRPVPLAVHAHAYLLRPAPLHPARPPSATPRGFARLAGGQGAVPAGGALAWQVTEVIAKHFAATPSGPWRRPAGADNPLGLDWLTLDYHDSLADAAAGPAAPDAAVTFTARLLAAPP